MNSNKFESVINASKALKESRSKKVEEFEVTSDLTRDDLDEELLPLYDLLQKEVAGTYPAISDPDEEDEISLSIPNKLAIEIVLNDVDAYGKFYVQYEGELRFHNYFDDYFKVFTTKKSGIREAVRYLKKCLDL